MTPPTVTMTSAGNVAGDKRYFVEMVDEVRSKLACLADDSPIKRCFPQSRLDAIRAKIEANSAEELEWTHWQPPFLFFRNSDDAAIRAFDDDLRLVESRSAVNDAKIFEFLCSNSEDAQPWIGGVFEVYIKATALRSAEVSNVGLDYKLPNGRRPDLKLDLDARSFCIECTSLDESSASNERWNQHVKSLQQDSNAVLYERQDAYTQSRRIFDKVFYKTAQQFDVDRSQLNADGPNLLMITLNAVTSDLAARSPAVGWALDELFSDQPNGNNTSASLYEWLKHKRNQTQQPQSSMDDLLTALSRVSGIVVFNGCKLGVARINYNAGNAQQISHAEMAAIERMFAVPPLYARPLRR